MSAEKCKNVREGGKSHSFLGAFALAAVLTAAALAPFAASAGSATLKCAGYTGTETLENFQALIKLDEGRYGFSYADCADQAAGTDVWFSSDAAGDAVLRAAATHLRDAVRDGDLVARLPLIHQVNTLGGLVFGGLKGLLVVWLLLWLDGKTGLLLGSGVLEGSYIAPIFLQFFPA